MDRQRSLLPYQDSPDSTTPQPTVLIVENVAQAVRERQAQEEAERRSDLVHLHGLSAALGRYALITTATTAGDDNMFKALVR